MQDRSGDRPDSSSPGQHLHQVLLDPLGLLERVDRAPHRPALNVRVDDGPLGDPEGRCPGATLTVLRATRGVVSSAMLLAIFPPRVVGSPSTVPLRLLAFCLSKPVERMIFSSVGSDARAMASGVGKRRNSSGVTMFTRSSVHWAEGIVAQDKLERRLTVELAGRRRGRALRALRRSSGHEAVGRPLPRVGRRVALVSVHARVRGDPNVGRTRHRRDPERSSRSGVKPIGSTCTSTKRRFRAMAAVDLGGLAAGAVWLVFIMVDSRRPCDASATTSAAGPRRDRVQDLAAEFSTSPCTTTASPCAQRRVPVPVEDRPPGGGSGVEVK